MLSPSKEQKATCVYHHPLLWGIISFICLVQQVNANHLQSYSEKLHTTYNHTYYPQETLPSLHFDFEYGTQNWQGMFGAQVEQTYTQSEQGGVLHVFNRHKWFSAAKLPVNRLLLAGRQYQLSFEINIPNQQQYSDNVCVHLFIDSDEGLKIQDIFLGKVPTQQWWPVTGSITAPTQLNIKNLDIMIFGPHSEHFFIDNIRLSLQ
ncbi:carbohydrate binding domain-containing protein [Zooshikella sp. RANM57]|uniref:carbohydrate binding domain-containing protein n=1 Tax=Zooshikella sp. RANM57 TaxID=3425863 RepID=UPI003D6F759F